MTDAQYLLRDLAAALGLPGGSAPQLIGMVRALAQQNQDMRAVLQDVLSLDSWEDDAIAPAELISRVRALAETRADQVCAPSARLSLLVSQKGPCGALLLESIHVTHADVLRFDHIEVADEAGLRVVSGDFRHLASGKRYVLSVTQIPEH